MSLEAEMMHKDWKNRLLKDCIIGKGSYGANVAALSYDPLLPRYLRITDIDEQGNLIARNTKSINLADAKSYYLEKGDIVFARTGSVGKTYLHKSNEVIAYASYLIRFRPNQKIILPEYLFLFTQSNEYRIWIKKILRSGVQSNINAEEYSNLPILIPPLPEQQKIANILRVWDESIKILTKLCHIKQQNYNIIARDIFSTLAKEEKWQAVKLSSIATIRKGKQLNRLDMKGGIYPVWNGGVIPSGFTDQWNMEANTITISEGGSCGFVNLCKEKFWLGGHCYSVTNLAANLNKYFLFFQLKQNEPKIMRLKTGSGLPNIQKPSLYIYLCLSNKTELQIILIVCVLS
ncbi:restriction endonuclease subunit S [Rickettsia hoogstraalii]|uniref:restriction endonuclease subunit S n=1 Tax=Rickettsia hoogstraalii TaxID=467174 RepID=UPI002258818F|nr:restriction endonuclease subunit S [Rickettsia hoogstraalii]MCX4083776.1 restriction endonuclease subunit S [Rickettsia hoogstraalii]